MAQIRSITVDTLTGIQNDEYMANQRKPGHDQWMDYGKDIYAFIMQLQQLGFEIIMVLGEPGTGKSSGMATLETKTNLWFNADKKNPVWKGGKLEYGTKNDPIYPYHTLPSTYQEVISLVAEGIANGRFEKLRYAFLTGHTETYKVGLDTKERLKILGKVGTKMQLEGKMETVFYSRVEMVNSTPTYILETQNNGFNTARSHQGMFEGKIPNDYNLVIEKLLTY